jgi:hypothetical protein
VGWAKTPEDPSGGLVLVRQKRGGGKGKGWSTEGRNKKSRNKKSRNKKPRNKKPRNKKPRNSERQEQRKARRPGGSRAFRLRCWPQGG